MKAPAFFSYAREDSEFVLRLASELKRAGANVWLDQLDIRPGRKWDREVERALDACQELVVILSPAAIDSNNVIDEVYYALDQGKTVIPLLFQACQVPFRLRRVQYVDFTSQYQQAVKNLLDTLAAENQPELEAAGTAADGIGGPASAMTSTETARKAEDDRIAHEKVEAARKTEEDRITQEKAEAARKAEEERIAHEKAEAARKAEEDRIAQEKAESARKAEEDRIAHEKAEAARKAEEDRIAHEKAAAARKAEEERIAREKVEKERLEHAQKEAAPRSEAERLPREQAEQETLPREPQGILDVPPTRILKSPWMYALGITGAIILALVLSQKRDSGNIQRPIDTPATYDTPKPLPSTSPAEQAPLSAEPPKPASPAAEATRRLLIGDHLMSLQYVSWDRFGRATVTEEQGTLMLRGQQREKDNYVTVEGKITEILARGFRFNGKVTTRASFLNGGQPCLRDGNLTFMATGTRKYWRMQEMDSPCENSADYVDIYFQRPAAPAK